MGWLQAVMAITQILPGLIAAIAQAMAAVERPGHGAVKKAAVLDVVQMALETADDASGSMPSDRPVSNDTVMKMAGGLIDTFAGVAKGTNTPITPPKVC